MSIRILLVVLICAGNPCVAQQEPGADEIEYAIAIHGGAGSAPRTVEWRTARERVLTQALHRGAEILRKNGSSLDTVEKVIRILEDSPKFKAGKGAVFNADGNHELDASIMDGQSKKCGAVGGVKTVKNPISLARRVMNDTRHILLVTDGADRFAKDSSQDPRIELVPNDYFSTEYQRQRLLKARSSERSRNVDLIGTVGCVALDRHGNLAAGTSTGGLVNKKFGRVGDSPIIGAGTYADNRTCAVSATGIGEDFIRSAVAFDVSARMKYHEQSLDDAIKTVLEQETPPVRGGLIGVSAEGEIVMSFNTPAMARAAANSAGKWIVDVGPTIED